MPIIMKQEGQLLIFYMQGKLSHSDYLHPKTGFVATLKKQAKKQDKLRVVINIDSELGWQSGAMCNEKELVEEFKEHKGNFAIVGNHVHLKVLLNIMSIFITDSLEFNYFIDEPTAIAWVKA